ncbi:sigma 54-interacting transcriptional regulator [Flavonifractor sp. HCP28S3_F3]|uniref:cyclase family protein n=1 Tax=Flavonifractor sp. HCP28S3_F3 TaxID=3438939 RepID=UPI003F8A4749
MLKEGKLVGAASLFRDTTEVNRLNLELERTTQVAAEYDRQLKAQAILKQGNIIGESQHFVNSVMKANTIAASDATVLLQGESGVGKEVFARLIYQNSNRKGKPFIAVNCAAKLKPGDVICLRTSAMTAWGTPEYLHKGCGVGREATLWLIDQGVHAVGTDAWSWDVPREYATKRFQETGDPSVCWEGHKAGAIKAYVQYEKLNNLEQLPPYGFHFFGAPVKVDRASAGWVRAFAIIDDKKE